MKKILSLVLALALVLCILPVLAEEEAPDEEAEELALMSYEDYKLALLVRMLRSLLRSESMLYGRMSFSRAMRLSTLFTPLLCNFALCGVRLPRIR